MNWIDRIRQAMDGELDPGKFERTACALLQPQYPGLSPIEGGTDLGRDADAYELPPGTSQQMGRLLATVGDPVKNVTTGLKRLQEEGLEVDFLVIACARPVSAKTRQRLDRLCASAELGAPTSTVGTDSGSSQSGV